MWKTETQVCKIFLKSNAVGTMGREIATVGSVLLKEDEEYQEESHQALMSWCEDAIDSFLKSSYCNSWKKNQKETAAFFIHGFVDYAYSYHLAKPFQYNKRIVEEMCLDILPRKFSTEPEDFKQVAPAMSAFFQWCEANGVIKNAKELCDKLKAIDEKIYKKAKNPKNWGMAKSMFSDFGF